MHLNLTKVDKTVVQIHFNGIIRGWRKNMARKRWEKKNGEKYLQFNQS